MIFDKSLFVAVKAIAPKTEYEEFYRIVEKRETGYETRILKDIQSGITLETFMAKGHRKTPERKSSSRTGIRPGAWRKITGLEQAADRQARESATRRSTQARQGQGRLE